MTNTNKGRCALVRLLWQECECDSFCLDTYVSSPIQARCKNLELDLNQVDVEGATVIFGTQCSSNTKTWGTRSHRAALTGAHPTSPADPGWAAKTWHHVQIGFHRNSSGFATHDWVNLDGTHRSSTNAHYNCAEHLGWQPRYPAVNYQWKGHNSGSGSITA